MVAETRTQEWRKVEEIVKPELTEVVFREKVQVTEYGGDVRQKSARF